MIDVDFSVPAGRRLVGAAVVAGRGAYRDSQRAGRREDFMEGIETLLVVGDFRSAPADRYDAGLAFGIVYGSIERVDEAFVAPVRREIHRKVGARRHRACHFDVEHHLTVGRVRRRRIVAGMVDGDRGDVGHLRLDLLEKSLQVTVAVAAAELDDRDGLSGAVELVGKFIARGEFRGSHAVATTRTAM